MATQSDSGRPEVKVTVVQARVVLSSIAQEPGGAGPDGVLHHWGTREADHLSLCVYLYTVLSDGRTVVTGPGPDLGLGGPRRGVWHRWHGPPLPDDPEEADRIALHDHRVGIHDIEDGINQMLGRDPTLHRPPRLAWGRLIDALAASGVRATEQELINAPLKVELTPEVESDLARS